MRSIAFVLVLVIAVIQAQAFVALPLRSRRMERRLRSSSSDTLKGCPGSDFSTSVTIGSSGQTQTFELTVDTGSSTLAVAGDSCCGTTSSYTTEMHKTATNTGVQVTSTYGDGSGWTGTIWTDTVSVGGVSVSGMKIAVQTSDSKFYQDSCNTNTINNQGIMGMAYESLAVSNGDTTTDSFPNAVEVAASSSVLSGTNAQGLGSGGGLIFGLQMCTASGQLFLGNDTNNNGYGLGASAPVYVPIIDQQWYVINLNSMLIGTKTLPNDFGTTIVDSGTTQLAVPQDIFDGVQTVLQANSVFVSQFGSDFLTGSECISSSKTTAQLNAALPTLTFKLDNGVALVVPAISSYLQELVLTEGTLYCPGIGTFAGGSNQADTILGWSFMNNFIVIFDRTTKHNSQGSVGFAPTTSCAAAAGGGSDVSNSASPTPTPKLGKGNAANTLVPVFFTLISAIAAIFMFIF